MAFCAIKNTRKIANFGDFRSPLFGDSQYYGNFWFLVPGTGLEPACIAAHAPKACVSTSSTTRAGDILIITSFYNYVNYGVRFLMARTAAQDSTPLKRSVAETRR